MHLIHVDSSMIAAVGYDPAHQLLVVLFNSGKAYSYHGVPPDVYRGLMAAKSKGQYMNDQVIARYSAELFSGWPESPGGHHPIDPAQFQLQYITDDAGQRNAVILPLETFLELINR